MGNLTFENIARAFAALLMLIVSTVLPVGYTELRGMSSRLHTLELHTVQIMTVLGIEPVCNAGSDVKPAKKPVILASIVELKESTDSKLTGAGHDTGQKPNEKNYQKYQKRY